MAAPVKESKGLYHALAAVRASLPAVTRDSTNPAFKSRYASLGAVHEAANPVLAEHGVLPVYSVRSEVLEDGRQNVIVGLRLQHLGSDEHIASELGMIPVKQDPQGIGSAITYARRYLLVTLLDLTVDDDDGNTASRHPAPADPAKTKAMLLKKMHALGEDMYGTKELWDVKREELSLYFSGGETGSSKELTVDQLRAMVEKMERQLRKQNALSA